MEKLSKIECAAKLLSKDEARRIVANTRSCWSSEPPSDVWRGMKCLRVQLSQQTVDLHVPD
jgi:hypothetical protein